MSDTPIEVVKVTAIEPHPNADRLEVVKVLATQFVAQKGGLKAGDLVAYFPSDMLIPEEVAAKLGVVDYLKHAIYPGDIQKTKCRISAIRLRGVASFGFGLPLGDAAVLTYIGKLGLYPGLDLSKHFKAEKYQPPPQCGGGGDTERQPAVFHTYTSIEHYYRNADKIKPGTPVRITEKIHGCLTSQTRIRMLDGRSKYIRDIEVGDFVVGYIDGSPTPSKVLKIWKNGRTESWLRIKFPRNRGGRGSSFGSITCTPGHHFLQEDGSYKKAQDLQEGDLITFLRGDWHLSPIQEQILLGKILGDATLCKSSANYHVEFGHACKELTEWTCRGLQDLIATTNYSHTSGYGSLIHLARTHTSFFISKKFQDFIVAGRKTIPVWVADELTPLAIAFWYMDDGSLGHHSDQEDRAHFAPCSFTEDECRILIDGLARFGIKAIYYVSNGYSRLRLNSDDAERLFLLIAPYIPTPLQYKLPERYRGHTGWLPSSSKSYKSAFIQRPISLIQSVVKKQQSWDLETETHNYLASNVVVHNSNSRVGLINDNGSEQCCGTHHCRVKHGNSIYWQPLTDDMREMLEFISINGQHNVIVFGEIYGRGIQKMDYGCDKGYEVFDISIDGEYQDWADVKTYCELYGIPTVPLLYEGPFKPEMLPELTSGPTTLAPPDDIVCKFKGREGIVIAPLVEEVDYRGNRVILKSVSPDYHQAM